MKRLTWVSAICGATVLAQASAALAADPSMDQRPSHSPPGTVEVRSMEAPAFGTAGRSSESYWSFQFQGRDPYNDNILDDGFGYRTMTGAGDSLTFIAGINLPAGIAIEEIELDNCDNQPAGDLTLILYESYGDHLFTNIADVTSTNSAGCKRNVFTLAAPYNHVVNQGRYLSLFVVQSMIDPTLKFRGAVVSFRRLVSPAPATASFTDVPTTDPAFRFVEALLSAGITGGCSANPPLYCPDNPLTRRQMAVFLSIALGLHWPN